MKKLSLLFIGFLLIPALFFTSCDRGDDPIIDEGPTAEKTFDVLKTYMVDNSLDINKIIKNSDDEKFVVGAPAAADLQAFLDKYYIIDIRSSDKFATSHIEGAKNVAFGDILAEGTAAGSKPVLVVCYTGQTACYATALMRMYGFKHTRALKWGMSGWNAETAGPWNGNIANVANGHANWKANGAAPQNVVYADPDLGDTTKDGEAILKERVEAVVAAGFQGVNGADVLNNPGGYFINNYFSETDYAGFGRIDGAYRILPLTLADESYKNLDPNVSQLVTYCYTGQTSAVISAALRVLGYNAFSMKFGMNGIYNANPAWTTNQWGQGSSVPKDLPLIK